MRKLVMGMVLAGCASAGHLAGVEQSARRDIEQLRVATRSYRTLDSAVAAGYVRSVPDCLVHEHHGAMGYHHLNRAYVDDKLEIGRPEILLYERRNDGSMKLNAVEYIIPYARWPRDSTAPVLMGQDLRLEDNLKIWYLHVWAWNENPNGVFADFHPRVSCPNSARKVFTPFVAGAPGLD